MIGIMIVFYRRAGGLWYVCHHIRTRSQMTCVCVRTVHTRWKLELLRACVRVICSRLIHSAELFAPELQQQQRLSMILIRLVGNRLSRYTLAVHVFPITYTWILTETKSDTTNDTLALARCTADTALFLMIWWIVGTSPVCSTSKYLTEHNMARFRVNGSIPTPTPAQHSNTKECALIDRRTTTTTRRERWQDVAYHTSKNAYYY